MMGRYVKESCPNCKTVISGWHHDPGLLEIGNPLIQCPKCKTNLVVNNTAEYIMFNPWLYFRYFVWSIIGGIIFSFVIGYIISGLISSESDTKFTLAIVFGAVLFCLFLARAIHVFKQEKKESLERTKDKQYLKALYQVKLISEKKYKEVQEYYKNIK